MRLAEVDLARIVFLHGGAEHARSIFEREGRVDWSQGLPVALEKHGLLELECVETTDFLARAGCPDAACVLIGDLAPAQWSNGLIDCVSKLARPVLIGGPPPEAVRRRLGISSATRIAPLGAVVPVAEELRRLGEQYGYSPSGRVAGPATRRIDHNPELEWSKLQSVPLSRTQAEAWQRWEPTVERWSVGTEAEVVCEWIPDQAGEPRSPGIVRNRQLRACAFGLFSLIGRAHTSEPWRSGEYRSSRRTAGFETLLLALIDQMYSEAGLVRVRVLPWPRGAAWALTVRHDFDRSLSPVKVRSALEGHRRAGTHATWYWRSRYLRRQRALTPWRRMRLGNQAIAEVVQAPHHEVAHHTERLWAGAEREQAVIESVSGTPVLGTSAHGDPGCFRFQGAPNILWAERQRLRYTELIQQAHFHPHRFVTLHADGTVQPSTVLCLPHHESFDLSMDEGDTNEQGILEAADRVRAVGGLLQVMNHPDINGPELFQTLATIPRAGRFNCTAAAATDWWNRTHVVDRFHWRDLRDGRHEIQSEHGVRGVVLELRAPYGARRSVSIDTEPGISIAELGPESLVAR
jgi:hypothetical protein